MNTLNEFIKHFRKDFPHYSEESIRKAIDCAAYFVRELKDNEQFVLHQYLHFLSKKFKFNIDTNIDSRD